MNIARNHHRIGKPRVGIVRPAAAAAANWWEVDGETCVAAYQAIGAADLATSYVNLANPGTYDAAPGVAPTFDAATGWTAAATTYLITGIDITIPSTWTAIVRYSDIDATSGNLLGVYGGAANKRFQIDPESGGKVDFGNGNLLNAGVSAAAGVLAIAGTTAYQDGSSVGTIPTGAAHTDGIYLMAVNQSDSPFYNLVKGKIQALAIYSTTLDADQVAALTTAMAALS